MFPLNLIEMVSKHTPFLGSALGSPIGSVVGNLISSLLGGVDMSNTEQVKKALDNPAFVEKLKELELQLTDLQNARLIAQRDTGGLKLIRPFLAVLAMIALVADIYAINYVTDKMLSEILIMMLVFLVWDIRQIYKFYFGSADDLPNPFIKKK